MITHVIWDLGDTILNPPPGGMDLKPLDQYPEIQLRAGVADTLRIIGELGYVQAVLSNTATTDSAVARSVLEALGVADRFAFVYATQSELTHDKPEKPDVAAFEIVLSALGIVPGQTVMIGNSWDNDILGANGAGLHAIWLRNPSVATRRDFTTNVQSQPWIVPAWDVSDVPLALQVLTMSVGSPQTRSFLTHSLSQDT